MTISDLKYTPFSLRLSAPFNTSSKKINERTGFIIKITDELGNHAFGECSPLPGFSRETLSESRIILDGLSAHTGGLYLEDTLSSITDSLGKFNLTPSLNFAFEQALINLICLRSGGVLDKFFPGGQAHIKLNAVIGIGKKESVIKKIREKIEAGFSTFKIKIGRGDIYDDFLLLKDIRNEFGNAVKLRLDANRAWSADEALEYLNRFQQFEIEYIEEPCEYVCSNFRLIEDSPVPIALDESLLSFENALNIIHNCNVKFLIVKPMILGGIIASLNLIREAEKKEKFVIISSSFESAMGKSALALLAASASHSLPHGFDTSDFFEKDLCSDPYKNKNGGIDFRKDSYPPQFELDAS